MEVVKIEGETVTTGTDRYQILGDVKDASGAVIGQGVVSITTKEQVESIIANIDGQISSLGAQKTAAQVKLTAIEATE